MSGFSIDWLNLREYADRCARDNGLRLRATQWLEAGIQYPARSVVVDLGAGTGATLRALTGPENMVQASLTWRLVDHDPELLAEARRRHGTTHRLEACIADLAQVARLPLEGARLVTASALFDLVSAGFLETLAARLRLQGQTRPVGVYAALNYDGTTHWSPGHPLDEAVLGAFNRDQRRDKGLGQALGPLAGAHTEVVFAQAGFTVLSASSPWQLDGTDSRLVSELIKGMGAAVARDPTLESAALKDWIRFRQSHVTTGTCEVGHTDILALPKEIPDQ